MYNKQKHQKLTTFLLQIIIFGLSIFLLYKIFITTTVFYTVRSIHKEISSIDLIEENKQNPKELKKFIKQHPATQNRHLLVNSKFLAYESLISYSKENKIADDCIKYSEELVKFYNQNYEYYQDLGDCYLLDGDRIKAFEAYKKAWNIKPSNKQLTKALIDIATIEGFEEEKKYFLSVYEIYPKTVGGIGVFLDEKNIPDPSPPLYVPKIEFNGEPKTYNIFVSDKNRFPLSNPPKYIIIKPLNHLGSGSTIELTSINIFFKDSTSLNVTNFSDWDTYNMEYDPKTNIFTLKGLTTYISSPNFSFSTEISRIEIKATFFDTEDINL